MKSRHSQSTSSITAAVNSNWVTLWNKLTLSVKSQPTESLLAPVEDLEDRVLLSAILPVFVDGVFSFGDPNSAAPYGFENTFKLASNPTATKTIYMDFTGFHSVNNPWGHDIVFDPFDRDGDPTTFSTAELIEIQKQFQGVAEDFFPFDVNVTTIEPDPEDLINRGGNDDRWGIRSLATQPKNGFGNGIGGVAFIGSFDWASDTPAFTFNKGVNTGAMTHSHEVGHTLRLRHDGLNAQAYHPGVGSGETSWGPIMGAPFGKHLVHWSKGEYQGANNFEDDLNIITTNNGFGFRADDHGDTISTATKLTVQNGKEISGWGIIERPTDLDFFSFKTGSGLVNISIDPFQENPNLDVEAKLFDSSGNLLATSNPLNLLGASFNMQLAAGEYFISVDGVGKPGVYTDYGSLGFYSIVGDIQAVPEYLIGESGLINLSSIWMTVNLNGFYTDPVIVASINSINDDDPATLRIRNVTSTSFQIQIDEWDYQNGKHQFESVNYMVMESGIHFLENGKRVLAGNYLVNHNWHQVQFTQAFDLAPVVLAQTVTRNGGAAVVTRIDDVSANGFKVKLQEEEAADGRHFYETVSWIAFETGVTAISGMNLDVDTVEGVTDELTVFNYNRTFDQAPALFAAMQTYNGNNTANTRIAGYTNELAFVFIEEETSFDDETGHVGERVGYVAIDLGDIFATRGFGEAGQIFNLTDEWLVVNLEQSYKNPVVVAGLATYNESDPITVRVRNVTSNSFEIQIDEWDFYDRFHAPEVVGYFVVEAGVHKLPDGTVIVADNKLINHHWSSVSYGHVFVDTPVVLSQMASENGPASATTRMDQIDNRSFSVRLQKQEIADKMHAFENVSWIAIEEGFGNSFFQSYTSMLYDGVSHVEEEIMFQPGLFFAKPIVFGNMQTYRDDDPATLRLSSNGASKDSMFVFVEEERSWDRETKHAVEQVGVFALGSAGVINGTTTKFFGGPIVINDSFARDASATSERGMAIVPRITYIDNGPEITETWLPFGSENRSGDGHAEICCCASCLVSAELSSVESQLADETSNRTNINDVAFAVAVSENTSPVESLKQEEVSDVPSIAEYRPGVIEFANATMDTESQTEDPMVNRTFKLTRLTNDGSSQLTTIEEALEEFKFPLSPYVS